MRRVCSGSKAGGPCRAAPLIDADFCLWHDPEHADEVAEARRLGGMRRRRDRAVAGAFGINGLKTLEDLQRVLEVGVFDLLGLENSVGRSRALGGLVQVGAKLLETGEFEERLAQLESVMEPRLKKGGRR
jgi:hypothetical protein